MVSGSIVISRFMGLPMQHALNRVGNSFADNLAPRSAHCLNRKTSPTCSSPAMLRSLKHHVFQAFQGCRFGLGSMSDGTMPKRSWRLGTINLVSIWVIMSGDIGA